MTITAFIRIPDPVTSHEQIPGIVEPVRVTGIDNTGAHLESELPPGQITVYDLLTYDDVEREETVPAGHRLMKFLDEEGESESMWVPVYKKETVIDRTPRIETFAVTVAAE